MRALVVDDEKNVAYMLKAVLETRGWQVETAENGRAGLDAFLVRRHDVVVTDLSMPVMDGLALLRAVHAAAPQTPVVLVTARGNERVAVEAMKAGAWDYFRKPFDNDEVLASLERAGEVSRLRAENAALKGSAELVYDPERSTAMRQLAEQIEKIAAKDVTVLVTGETGTGKEVVARRIHDRSPRRAKAFVALNCSALTESLVESELFGWEKGAFTGAVGARAGYFEQADGGTLFLDEIGDMPLALQAKLLRVLQERVVQRLGSTKSRPVDVRVIAATHHDLTAAVKTGAFREDLFYRLNVVHLHLPPLRERPGDAVLLAQVFGARFGEKYAVGPVTFAPGLLETLATRPWPGNVRELAHAVERAVALSQEGHLTPADFESLPAHTPMGTLPEQVDAYERGLILKALEAHAWNQSATARSLGIARVTLIDKIKKYGLKNAP